MTSKEIEELAGHRLVSAWVVKLVNDAIAATKKEWVGLTDEEIFGMFGTYVGDPDYNHNKLLIDARRIEAKLTEKNGG